MFQALVLKHVGEPQGGPDQLLTGRPPVWFVNLLLSAMLVQVVALYTWLVVPSACPVGSGVSCASLSQHLGEEGTAALGCVCVSVYVHVGSCSWVEDGKRATT